MKNKTTKQETQKLWHPGQLITGVFIVCLLIIVMVQFLYPANRALPFTRFEGTDVGGKTSDDIIASMQQKYAHKITFKADSKTVVSASLAEAGIVPRFQETTRRIVEYAPVERLVPFSIFLKQLVMTETKLQYRIDAQKLQQFVKNTILPACNVKPLNAKLSVARGDITIQDGTSGRQCHENEIIRRLQNAPLTTSITLPVKVVSPTKDRSAFEPLVLIARQRIAQGITIRIESEIQQPDRVVLATWFVFQEDPRTKRITLGADKRKISTYLEQLNSTFRRDPIATQVFTLDGQPERRVPGKDGRTLNIQQTAAAIAAAISESTTTNTVTAAISRITAGTEYIRNYGGTNAGLSMLLQDLAAEKGQYGITVIELSGKRRQASANGTQIFTTASTYKMFVAYSVLKQIEAGLIRWNQPIREGMNTVACFDEMIRYSLNPCSWTFKDMVGGWARIEAQMRNLGLANTYLVQNNLRSTSNDEALFMRRLEEGTSLSGESRQFLLRLFREQIYRSGIPSGVQWPVANKIGFLDGFLHDVGIVYSPKGTYVLGVMTYGGSWSQIADVARRVDAVMQR